jgi:hypothetical protein
MVMDRAALEELGREALIIEARRWAVKRPEVMTRAELVDEVLRLGTPNPVERKKIRGWLGVARDLLASVVEQGLNLPDAAAMIRGDVRFEPLKAPQPPVATVTLAEIYGAQGHIDRATGILDEVLAKEPDHAIARNLRDRLGRERVEKPMVAKAIAEKPMVAKAVAEEPITQGSAATSAALTASRPDKPEPVRADEGRSVADDAAVFARTSPSSITVYFETGAAPRGKVVVRVVEVRPRPSGGVRVVQDVTVAGPAGAKVVLGLEPGSVVRAALGRVEDGQFRPLSVAAEVRRSAAGVEVEWSSRRGVDPAAVVARSRAALGLLS